MAQFDVYRAAGSLLLDVQTDLLEDFKSRVMVPLLPPGTAPIPHPRLNPTFVVDGQRYHMVTQFIGAIRSRDLGQPIDNLDRHYDQIRAALDMIFLGF